MMEYYGDISCKLLAESEGDKSHYSYTNPRRIMFQE
jgi:hypothetical protein